MLCIAFVRLFLLRSIYRSPLCFLILGIARPASQGMVLINHFSLINRSELLEFHPSGYVQSIDTSQPPRWRKSCFSGASSDSRSNDIFAIALALSHGLSTALSSFTSLVL